MRRLVKLFLFVGVIVGYGSGFLHLASHGDHGCPRSEVEESAP